MVYRKEGGREEGLMEGMDQGMLAVNSGSAAKGSARGLEVAGSGPVQMPFPLPPFFPIPCAVHNCY